ncbi:MAG: C40 family peptidase [Mangrovicoccus sp.]|nr:C40 family peptidase [Mangrovicoccus sp.]
MAKSFLKHRHPLQISSAVADLLDHPEGARARQLVYGELVVPLDEMRDHVLAKAERDGYVGYIPRRDLSEAVEATHRVIGLATHLYREPDFKSPDVMSLSFGSYLNVTGDQGRFYQTHTGHFVPKQHVARASLKFDDPAAVAELFLGTPYLWGGNSRLGLDCSGLVQAACLACGIACPGDSGDQARDVGFALDPGTPLRRSDLIFWEGHVAMMVNDTLMIHANAHHMATVFEPLAEAAERIEAAGDGAIKTRRRPVLAKSRRVRASV